MGFAENGSGVSQDPGSWSFPESILTKLRAVGGLREFRWFVVGGMSSRKTLQTLQKPS